MTRHDENGSTSDYVAALLVVAAAIGATMAGCGDDVGDDTATRTATTLSAGAPMR